MVIWRKMVWGWWLVSEGCVDGDSEKSGVGMVMDGCRWKLVRKRFANDNLRKGGYGRAKEG